MGEMSTVLKTQPFTGIRAQHFPPAFTSSHLRSSSCRRRLCFSFCMFLETLNTSLGKRDFKIRGNKLMGEKIQTSLSQGHSWYSQRQEHALRSGEFRGSSTVLGAGMVVPELSCSPQTWEQATHPIHFLKYWKWEGCSLPSGSETSQYRYY